MKETPSFLSVLHAHLKAIEEKNLEKFEPTVAENVSTIDPNGIKTDGKKSFWIFIKPGLLNPIGNAKTRF